MVMGRPKVSDSGVVVVRRNYAMTPEALATLDKLEALGYPNKSEAVRKGLLLLLEYAQARESI